MALKYLTSVLGDAEFDPSLVVGCFNIFVGAISVDDQRVGIIPPGLEKLAPLSARCFYSTFHRLAVTDPTSKVLKDIRQRYREDFPYWVDFSSLSPYPTLAMIRALVAKGWTSFIRRNDNKLSDHDHSRFARDIAELAQAEYHQQQKVPDWILSVAFDYLSLNPLPPAFVVVDCLKVIAIHLDCDISDAATLDERYTFESYWCPISDQETV